MWGLRIHSIEQSVLENHQRHNLSFVYILYTKSKEQFHAQIQQKEEREKMKLLIREYIQCLRTGEDYKQTIWCCKLKCSHRLNMWSLAPNMAALNCLVFKSPPSKEEPNLSSHCVGLWFSLSSTHSEVISMSSNWIGSDSRGFVLICLANLRL